MTLSRRTPPTPAAGGPHPPRRPAHRFLAAGGAVLLLAGCHPTPPATSRTDPLTATQHTSPPSTPAAGDPHTLLDQLTVGPAQPLTGYNRSQYGQAWTDNVDVLLGRNGCDTRNDQLKVASQPGTVRTKPGSHGCKVTAGTWISPYTGQAITNRAKVSIDHIVPLAVSWRSGAQTWTARQRQNFANDPIELLPVDTASNAAKGDSTPDHWVPAINRCFYARRWIIVKTTYRLTITATEKVALENLLDTCGAAGSY